VGGRAAVAEGATGGVGVEGSIGNDVGGVGWRWSVSSAVSSVVSHVVGAVSQRDDANLPEEVVGSVAPQRSFGAEELMGSVLPQGLFGAGEDAAPQTSASGCPKKGLIAAVLGQASERLRDPRRPASALLMSSLIMMNAAAIE